MEADAVMDVGKVLQDARIAKNISLDTAAQETNIRKAYLEAIEQNDFPGLHGDVFVKGVMRTYGNYLGLDGAQLVEEYKAASTETGPVGNNNAIRESQHVKVRPTFKSNRDIGSGNGNEHSALFWIAGIFVLLLAAAGGFYFYLMQTGQAAAISIPFRLSSDAKVEKQNTGTVKTENVVKEQEKGVPTSHEANSVSEKKNTESVIKESKAVEKKTNVKITSTGKCWLRVTDQKGAVLFEGNLQKGDSKSFVSDSSITMRIGNLKVLQIEHNGKVLPFEEAKEAITRTYAPAS